MTLFCLLRWTRLDFRLMVCGGLVVTACVQIGNSGPVDPAVGIRHTLQAEGMRVMVDVGGTEPETEFGPRFDRTLRVVSWSVEGREMLTAPGLVSEYGLRGEGVLGFAEAAPGGTFLKLGVGLCRREDERPYFFSRRYPVLDPGTFRELRADRSVLSAEWISPRMGAYQVRQVKTLRVEPGRLTVDTVLENIGEQAFPFSQYNHQFLNPTGARVDGSVTLRTAFPLRPVKPHPFLDVEEQSLRVNRRLPDERSAYLLTEDAIPQSKNRLMVQVDGQDWMELTGDFDASHFEFFALDGAFCPEVFLRRRLEPGQETRWRREWRIPTAGREE